VHIAAARTWAGITGAAAPLVDGETSSSKVIASCISKLSGAMAIGQRVIGIHETSNNSVMPLSRRIHSTMSPLRISMTQSPHQGSTLRCALAPRDSQLTANRTRQELNEANFPGVVAQMHTVGAWQWRPWCLPPASGGGAKVALTGSAGWRHLFPTR